MDFHSASEVHPGGSGLLCRQSRVMGCVSAIVMSSILAGAPVLWRWFEAPWPVWGGCTLLAVFVVPFLVQDMRAKFRPTNWVLWIRRDGLWIHFESYQDCRPDDVDADVVHLEYAEIARIQRHVETYSTPSGYQGRRSTRWTEKALLIHLNQADTGTLQEALAAVRSRPPVERVLLGFVRVRSRATHFAVTMPSPTVIRIAWRGGRGNYVVPALETVLDHLATYVAVGEGAREDRPDWHEMDAAQLDEQIRNLVNSGSRLEAIRLLVRSQGLSMKEARQQIKELARSSE